MGQDHGRIRCIIKTVTFVYTYKNAYELCLFFQNMYVHIYLARGTRSTRLMLDDKLTNRFARMKIEPFE